MIKQSTNEYLLPAIHVQIASLVPNPHNLGIWQVYEIRDMDLNGFLGPRSTDHSFNAFNEHFIL